MVGTNISTNASANKAIVVPDKVLGWAYARV
jgi:hypothetical protein